MKTNKGVKGLGKKFKIAIVSVAVCLALAVSGAISALVLSNRGDGLNPSGSGIIADVSAITANTSYGTLSNGSKYNYTNSSGNSVQQTVNTSAARGNIANPYVISSKETLLGFLQAVDNGTSFSGQYFVLGGDIDCSGNTLTHTAYPSSAGFAGYLYGRNYTIKNAVYNCIKNGTGHVMGLFTRINGGTVADVGIDASCKIAWTNSSSSLVAGDIFYIGGFAGIAVNATFINCANYANISFTNTSTIGNHGVRIGSMVGQAETRITMRKCTISNRIDIVAGADSIATNSYNDNSTIYGAVSGYLYGIVDIDKCNINLTTTQKHGGGCGASISGQSGTITDWTVTNSIIKCYQTVTGNQRTTDICGMVYGGISQTTKINMSNTYLIAPNANYVLRGVSSTGTGNFECTGGDAVSGSNLTVYPSRLGNSAHVTQLTSESAVISAAKGNTNVTSHTNISDDGSLGSKTAPASNFTITYKTTLGGTMPSATTYKTDTAKTLTKVTAGITSGYTFRGWAVGSAGGTYVGSSIAAHTRTGNLELYANYNLATPTYTNTPATVTYEATNTKISVEIKSGALTAGNATIDSPVWKKGSTTISTSTGTNGIKVEAAEKTSNGYKYTLTFSKPTVAQGGDYTFSYNLKATKTGVTSLNNQSQTVKLTVNKKVIKQPTLSGTYTYNAEQQTVAWSAPDSRGPNDTNPAYTITGDKGTNAATYKLIAQLTDKNNYVWETTNNANNIEKSWTINKATIAQSDIVFNATDNIAYVGQPYSAIPLTGTATIKFKGENGPVTKLEGTYAWKTPNAKITNGAALETPYNFTAVPVFTPNDTNINPIERSEGVSALVIQLYIQATETKRDGTSIKKNIPVDYGSNFSATTMESGSGEHVKLDTVVTYTVNGVTKTNAVWFEGNEGYGTVVGSALDASNRPIGKTEFTNITQFTDGAIYVIYTAQPTKYTVYHAMQNIDSSYPTEEQIRNGGDGVTKEVLNDRETASKVNPQSLGKATFTGFALDRNKTSTTEVVLEGDGSSEIFVYYARQSYTLTFYANGANTYRSQSKTFLYEEEISVDLENNVQINTPSNGGADTKSINKPVKNYNTFVGWYFDTDCTDGNEVFGTANVPKTFKMPCENTTVYAKFEATQYAVSFLLNNSYNTNSLPEHPGMEDVALNGEVLSIIGETYEWDTEALFNGTLENRLSGGDGKYTLTYDTTVLSASKSLRGIVPAALGYKFNNWMEYNASTGKWAVVTGINRITSSTAEERTLVASWTPINYNFRFDTMGGSTMSDISAMNTGEWSDILPKSTPTKVGYSFVGWAPTAADAESGVDEDGLPVGNFIGVINGTSDIFGENFYIYDFIAQYGEDGTYDRSSSTVTLYAIWESRDVTITVDENYNENKYGKLSFAKNGSTVSGTVKVGDEITVTATTNPGYTLNRISVNGTFLAANTFTFRVESYYGETITVSAEFKLDDYSITYERNGGNSTDTNVIRKYNVENADSIVLPSLLTKRGYDFKGWTFARSGSDAFTTTSAKENLYGETLIFSRTTISNILDNVILEAVWEAQDAPVYLYNATYDSMIYNPKDGGYEITEFNNDTVKTGETIEIINPVRQSFDFVGWATRANGSVVYPAVSGVNTISYQVNADHDINDKPLNANNLYAVWHVSGVERINMTVDGNNGVYGGKVTMSASPETEYSNSDVTLNFTWYLVFTDRYELCFKDETFVNKDGYAFFVDENGDTVGKYLATDASKTLVEDREMFPDDGGRKTEKVLTYKVFNTDAAAGKDEEVTAKHGCKWVASEGFAANESGVNVNSYTIDKVNQSGLYICYVTATGNLGTNASGYGEIEAILQKSTYSGLELNGNTQEYNAAAQKIEVAIPDAANGAISGDVITLPDGSRVRVTYTYKLGETEVAAEDVKNVGTYSVVATFSWITNEGNYEDLIKREAELSITPKTITNIEYVMNHDGGESANFSVGYDGEAYRVTAKINDKFSIDPTAPTVAAVDGIALELNVYKIVETGAEHVDGATVDAGSYYVLITGITGEKSENYTLGNITKRRDYTINKATRDDVISNIKFNDVDDAVFNNEIHKVEIELKEGYELPEGVEYTYEKTDYVPEDPNFNSTWYNKTDAPNNGGYYAGVYTITAKFSDENSNYEPIADMTAKLTIAKADFFDFYDKEAMLTNAGFKSETYGYLTDANYVPFIERGDLAGAYASAVTLSYDYYKYATTDVSSARTPFLSVTQAEAENHKEHGATDASARINGINESGLYAVVVNIEYVDGEKYGMLFSNNLNLPTEEERTIYYEISEGVVSGIEVVFDSNFDKDNVQYDTEFIISNINSIVVDYGVGGKTPITYAQYPDRIANVEIDYGTKSAVPQNTFWHVGTFEVVFKFYGATVTETFTVKQSIEDVTVEYSADGGATWRSAESAQLDLDAESGYKFRITYYGINESGNRVSKTTAVKDATLVHGKNELEAAAEDYYTFENADISVQVYKTVNTVTWEYSEDGTTWRELTDEVTSLPYIGKEYQVRAAFEGVDGTTTYSNATVGNMGLVNWSASGYTLKVLTENNYIVSATRDIAIGKIVAEFTWSASELPFNAHEQNPVATPVNMVAADLANLSIRYRFTDENGGDLTAAQVIRAGKYNVSVVLSGSDSTLLNNYTLEGSGSASHSFEIKKADIEMTATYNEADYGEGKTYYKNPHGLRTSALKANFTGAEVDGTFTFIYDLTYDSEGNATFKTFEKESDIAELLVAGKVYIDYVFTPTNSFDYNTKYGRVELDVLGQSSRTGNNSLTVELGTGAYSYYLVNQTFSTVGIKVYREYNSFYVEGAGANRKTYGRRDELTSGINFSLEGKSGQADGKKITAADLAGGKITLIATAIDGSNGRRDFEVIDSDPSEIILPDNLETEFYVNQRFDYSKISTDGSETVLFTVVFDNGENVKMTKGDVSSDYDNHVFTANEVGKVTVTFSAFGGAVSKSYEITVKPKEELFDRNNPHDGVLVFDDEVTMVYEEGMTTLPVPAIKYDIDGDGVAEDTLEGISYTTTIRKNGSTVPAITGVGEYEVEYAFRSTNPRFNTPATNITIRVHVTEEKYTYEFIEPEQKEFAYTGNIIAASNANGTLVKVWDLTNPSHTVDTRNIKIEYLVDGVVYKTIERGQEKLEMEKWNVKDVKPNGYKIEVRVYVDDGEGFGDYIRLVTTQYTLDVVQAENPGAKLTSSKNFVIVGKDTDLRTLFSVNADFGKDTGYYEYKKDGEASFTRGLPEITDATVGKYQIRYYIPGTTNYKEAEAFADIEIRSQSIKDESNGNSFEIIDGVNGIGAGVELKANKINSEDLETIKIKRQTVIGGYDVNLVMNGETVTANGEVTVRVKLGDEYAERTNLNVYLYEDGKATKLNAEIDEEGYLVFTASRLGRIAITESVVGAPVGLIVGVSIGAVVAAGLIVACVLVFLKKRGE